MIGNVQGARASNRIHAEPARTPQLLAHDVPLHRIFHVAMFHA